MDKKQTTSFIKQKALCKETEHNYKCVQLKNYGLFRRHGRMTILCSKCGKFIIYNFSIRIKDAKFIDLKELKKDVKD